MSRLLWEHRFEAVMIEKVIAAFLLYRKFLKSSEIHFSLHQLIRYVIFLFLTVSKNKIAATPENIGVVAILTVVLNYSILFPSFTFFLDGFHLAFGDKFEICIKTTDLM